MLAAEKVLANFFQEVESLEVSITKSKMSPPFRVSIIGGGGMVGAATAYALILGNAPVEVILVDVAVRAAVGQALDVADAAFASNGTCRDGTFADAGQSDLVVITAGYPQKPGETRAQLLGKNKEIMRSIFDQMQPIRPDLKILVVANPVDVLTHLAWKLSGLPKKQVFGSGTLLDSGRLREELAIRTGVHPSQIDAYVLGEHGDRQFVAWSLARIGGQVLLKHPSMKSVVLDDVMNEVMRKAYAIIDAKRSTYFGIGMCTARITESILFNRRDVYPLTNWSDKFGAYISWPCAVGSHGIEESFDLEIDAEETKRLHVAVDAIKEMVAEAEQV